MPSPNRSIDPTSRFFILTEAFLGLNRINLLQKLSDNQKLVSKIWTTIWTTFTITTSLFFAHRIAHVSRFINTCEYNITSTISFILIERLMQFYKCVEKFDEKLGKKPKSNGKHEKLALVFILIPIVVYSYNAAIKEKNLTGKLQCLFATIVEAIHNLEFIYFSYLQSMITSRIGLIVEEVEKKQQPRDEADTAPFSDMEMRKFIKLYYILIKVFDRLVSAIKWQFCVMLVLPYTSSLFYWLRLANSYIVHEKLVPNGVSEWILLIVKSLGFIALLCSVSLHAEWLKRSVLTLRSTLTRYRYRWADTTNANDHKLVSTFIALTETRDLSFILLGMVKINAALPFKLVSSVVTYLVIFHQFRKLIPTS